ncbi:hypothetical protein ACF073_03320 [Streptomyces sp. NPDC015171]|uniref:hypothetical protein n=1 Tax=Streptomyces sp. NPDC015171 TaxID=3364945 RepID=UPI0037034A16
MRMFQRVAVVAAAVAGISAFGAGIGFAGENDAPPAVVAEANSSANAVAVGGAYYAPPEGQPQGQPEEQRNGEPEQGYGEHQYGEGE